MGPVWESMYKTNSKPRKSPVKGIYLDIGYSSGSGSNAKKGRTGINLGSCFPGWPDGFNQVIHTPAFLSSSSLEQSLVNFFNRENPVTLSNAEELKSKILWFLAEKSGLKYFCDGISLYAVSTSSIRVARNAINSISERYAVYRDGRLQCSGNKELEALLAFAFRRSFVFDEFEKIAAAQPDRLENWSHYTPTTIIGSDEHNVIDVSYGLGDVVYTGEGNNVISVGSTINYYNETRGPEFFGGFYTWAKYIVGGSGENTLVIQYMSVPARGSSPNHFYGNWHLRNIDNPVTNDTIIRKNHVVYLKNIPTIEVRQPNDLYDRYPHYFIDATDYDGARRYILSNIEYFHGPLKTEKDVTVLPRRLIRGDLIKFGEGTKNTISFKYYEDERYQIDTINI